MKPTLVLQNLAQRELGDIVYILDINTVGKEVTEGDVLVIKRL
jgi:glycine cleavage system H lipoate-binding protein